nr:hypothetical protein [Ardenticatenales bacterium]
ALLRAVRRCWASLWSERAVAYRARQGIDPAQVALAVVIQKMVPAEAAGVLFTVHPVTGATDQIVINAAWGLGESVVLGRVTPDALVLDKATATVRESAIGEKAVMTAYATVGTIEQSVAEAQRRKAVLTPAQTVELARLGREIETLFGVAQDIEWAIEGERSWILQARPVTVVAAAGAATVPGDDHWFPEDSAPAQPFDLWTRANFGEVLPYPVSPLTLSGFYRWGERMAAQQGNQNGEMRMARRLYGRIYANEGAMRQIFINMGMPTSMIDSQWGSRRPDLPPHGTFSPLRFLRSLPGMIRGMSQTLRPSSDPQSEALPQEAKPLFALVDAWLAAFQQRDLSQESDQALWEEAQRVWEERKIQMSQWHLMVSQKALAGFAPLETVVGWWAGDKAQAQTLVTGLSGVYSAEMGVMLWRLAQQIKVLGLSTLVLDQPAPAALASLRATPAAEPALHLLDEFLARHGHRRPAEPELLLPRWSEAPEEVIALVAGYLKVGAHITPIETEARQRDLREQLSTQIAARLDPVRRRLFNFLLGNAQAGVRRRDNSRHYLAKVDLPRRQLFAELGRRWHARGWLAQPDDFFFLIHDEISRSVEANHAEVLGKPLKEIAAARRLAYEYWFTVEAPEAIGPDDQPLSEPAGSTDAHLQGVPASQGRVQGIARLLDDPREAARLQPGDILVTRSTDPGWTPVFPLVAGLVLEIGGQLSHGAIVAREYGVPAVVNVYGAMHRIREGDRITVDGTLGRVYLE